VGWPSYVGYVGVGLGGELSRQTLARFSSTLGEPGACEFASVFAAQNLASLSSPQQAAAVDFLKRLLLTHEGVSILVQVSVHLHAADRLFCHAMCAQPTCCTLRSAPRCEGCPASSRAQGCVW